MSERSVARKYASALFQLAVERGLTARVRKDLEGLVALMRESPDFVSFVESPNIPNKEKSEILERTLRGRLDDAMFPFLFLLLKRGRVGLLPKILAEFEKRDEEKSGIMRAEVVTVVPLGPREKELIVSGLKRITGKEILLRDRVDPGIIGGAIVYVDGDVIDGSVRAQLAELRATLLAVQVAR
jgi:F-type H+-transporting ATPase subunit delta